MNTNAATGNLAGNWPYLIQGEPAIIVNPAASLPAVLAWCWGEVESLRQAAEALSGVNDGIEGEVIYAVFLHRLTPLAEVMHNAVNTLATSPRQDAYSNGGAA